MSIQTFIQTVETDVTNAFHTLEGDAELALTAIWNAAKPVLLSAAPTLVNNVLAALTAFLATAAADVKSGGFDDIEQAFLEDLEKGGSVLLADAQSLGSDLLQVLVGLAKGIKA